jgi:hypothetical protein
MLIRTRVVVVLALVTFVLGLRGSALALPEALTKAEVGCQTAVNKALPAYGKARTGCIAKCQKKTPNSSDCSTPFGGKTLECVQKADAKLAGIFAKKCPTAGTDEDACPECYEELSGACPAFGGFVTAKSIALTDGIASVAFCNDSGSPDGLTKAEAKCQSATAAGYQKFVASATKCETSCLKAERKGKTDGTCNPEALLFLSGDSKTVTCLFKAFANLSKATAKCAPPGDFPECMAGETLFTDVTEALSDIGGDVAVCPAECGDNFTQGVEQCDPPGSTLECPGFGTCTAGCACP